MHAQASKEEEALFVAKKAFEDGFYEVSLGLLDRFLKGFPTSTKKAEVNLLIGQCYFHQDKYLDALTEFEKLLNDPSANNIKDAVVYWIAEVHFRGNDFAKASTYYQKITDEFPNSAYTISAYYSLGWSLFQEAKYEEALKYFEIVESKYPNEPQANDSSFKIIECLYNLKDYSVLKERLSPYLKKYANDNEKLGYLCFYAAEADYYLDNFNEAVEEYSKAITNTKDAKLEALSKLGLGWAYLKLKQYKEAEDALFGIKPENLEQASKDVLSLARAILMAETKRFSEAKNIYDQLLQLNPDPQISMQAYLGKAGVLYSIAEYKEAIEVYKEALQKAPETIPQEINDKLHYGLAWAYLKEGEFKSAIDEFKKVVSRTGDKIIKVAALCRIGDTYQDSGDYEKAIEAYDRILKDYPDSFYGDYVQYQLGLTLLKSHNYDGAILAFQNLKKQYSDSKLLDDATYTLGLAYFQREDYSSSKDVFGKFQEELKDSSLRSQALYLLGSSLYNLGKYAEAIEAFKNIIRLHGQDTEMVQKAEYEIADCYFQMGDEKEAMNRFIALRSKYPDSSLTPEIIWWLGEYYYRQNDLTLARRYFLSLIQDFPKSNLVASCYYALGSTYEAESLYDEAINNFKRVLEADKTDLAGTAMIAIADIYTRQEKFDSAIQAYKDALREYPHLAHLIYPKIAELYAKLGNYADAAQLYLRSLELVPVRQMSQIQFKLAEVLQAEGKIEEAIEEYMKVTYLYSEDNNLTVKSLLRVAELYENKQNYKEAINIYKRIASLNVEESKYAQERIGQIMARKGGR